MLHCCGSLEQRSPACIDTAPLDLVAVGGVVNSGCHGVLGILDHLEVRLAQAVREGDSLGLDSTFDLAESWQTSACHQSCARTRTHAG